MTGIIRYLNNRLSKGKSPIILVVGEQRSGKTALALRIAYEVDKKFDIKKQMFFDIREFATAMHKFNKRVLILDEAGVSLDPYEHMSIKQRVYNHIVQTQAYKQNIIMLVLPFASEIGKQHRKHTSAIIECRGHGRYIAYAVMKWYSDLSLKPPRLMTIEEVYGVPLPPPHIWNTYLDEFEKSYKESILELQRGLLDLKHSKPDAPLDLLPA